MSCCFEISWYFLHIQYVLIVQGEIMRFTERPVVVTNFGQINDGDLFVLTSDLATPTSFAVIYRKICPYNGFNAIAEFFEGESCNRGMVTIDEYTEITPLM
jgi:hypothetical protein